MLAFITDPIPVSSQDFPGIIREAAKSKLGIFALMILIVAGLAYAFFKSEGNKVKAPVFIGLVLGVAIFGYATVDRTNIKDYTIQGKVLDLRNKNPIEAASVRVEWGSISQPVESAPDGAYSFLIEQDARQIPQRIKLSAEKSGYRDFYRTVESAFFPTAQTIVMLPNNPVENTPQLPLNNAQPPDSCSEIASLHSIESREKSTIQVRNSSKELAQLFWIDYKGNAEFWAELQPDTFTTFLTYVGHPWVIRDITGKCLTVFIPKSTAPFLAEIPNRQ